MKGWCKYRNNRNVICGGQLFYGHRIPRMGFSIKTFLASSYPKSKRYLSIGLGLISVFTGGIFAQWYYMKKEKYQKHIIIVGGGIMGSWSAYLLAKLISNNHITDYRVTLIDAGHPIRGSWGETRALHVAMEDDLRIKMNMLNANEYLKLQRDAEKCHHYQKLMKKVGRVFVGPTDSAQKMADLLKSNDIPVDFINEEFKNHPKNKHVIDSLRGVQLRSEETGFEGWASIYTPVGYVLKADAILEYLREQTHEISESINQGEKVSNVSVLEDKKVVKIDRLKKKVWIKSCYDDDNIDGGQKENKCITLNYDKLLLSTGPWINKVLGSSIMHPGLPKLPIVVSNEQTQNFFIKRKLGTAQEDHGHYSTMPLVTYSDGGYVRSGGDYWFIVGPTADDSESQTTNNQGQSLKIGFHRQGNIMHNDDFQLPNFNDETQLKRNIIDKLPHIRKEVTEKQSFETDEFILDKAKAMCKERFSYVDVDNIDIIMRCLYQNTSDKEFIVGYHNDDDIFLTDRENFNDIVVACGFNGGGFQMGPMIARLCIKLLFQTQVCTSEQKIVELIKAMEIENEKENLDYSIKNIDMMQLLKDMENRFDPSRQETKCN